MISNTSSLISPFRWMTWVPSWSKFTKVIAVPTFFYFSLVAFPFRHSFLFLLYHHTTGSTCRQMNFIQKSQHASHYYLLHQEIPAIPPHLQSHLHTNNIHYPRVYNLFHFSFDLPQPILPFTLPLVAPISYLSSACRQICTIRVIPKYSSFLLEVKFFANQVAGNRAGRPVGCRAGVTVQTVHQKLKTLGMSLSPSKQLMDLDK
jgi:hypothetical protein